MQNNNQIIYRKIDIAKSSFGIKRNDWEIECQRNAYQRSLSALRYVNDKLELGLTLPDPDIEYIDLAFVYEQIINLNKPSKVQRIEDMYWAYLYGGIM